VHATCNKRRKTNWIGHACRRSYLTKHVIEGKMEKSGKQGKDVSRHWITLKKIEDTGN
jgi:hypothetical protein